MMKRLLLLAAILLPMLAMAQQAQSKKKIAIYVMGEDAGVNKVLGNKLVSAIVYDNRYTAVERTESFLAQLQKEQKYQRTGAVDDSELSRLGKQFGAQYVCVAVVSEAFDAKYLTARLIDVGSAQVVCTSSLSMTMNSLSDVVYSANELSHNLLSRYHNSKQSNAQKVAVYVIKNDAAKDIGRVIGDKLVEGFTNSGRYVAIERTNSFLTQLSNEQKYQSTGAVDDNDISRLGKQFGVQYVCTADISDVLGEKYISARLIDVETAEVVNTYDVGGAINDMNTCIKKANEIASELSKSTLAELRAEEAKIHDYVEMMPQFPGGDDGLYKYLSENIKYPAVAEEKDIQGRVVCTFVVERDGSITNVQVVRSVDPSLDAEAVRLLKTMPRWIPGSQNGKLIRVKYKIPVSFKNQEENISFKNQNQEENKSKSLLRKVSNIFRRKR